MINNVQAAAELRKCMQFFLETLDTETQLDKMLAVTSVYPIWAAGKAYAAGEVFCYGENSVGDPQLYQVLQPHSSAEQWLPDTAPSLYKAIGVTEEGYPEWVQPLGGFDAYNVGDIVSRNGVLYRSLTDGNVWAPEAYTQGWEKV